MAKSPTKRTKRPTPEPADQAKRDPDDAEPSSPPPPTNPEEGPTSVSEVTDRQRQQDAPTARNLRLAPSPTAAEGPPPAPAAAGPPITLRLSVIHAGLEHASHPLAVGHYAGDVLTGAEWVLDDRLGRKLSNRRAMGLYPGPEGTAEVMLAPGMAPPGALVIGLGEIGELTADIVTNGVVEAALRLALAQLEQPEEEESASDRRSAAFSTLLIGTRGGRTLSIESSITAIVTGALLANRVLVERQLIKRVCIDEIQFVEIHEDLAIRAAHALGQIESFLRLGRTAHEQVAIEPYLLRGEGGFAGSPARDYEGGWWRRLQISQPAAKSTDQDDGQLDFLLLTERARAEQTMQATQRRLVERLVEQTIGQTGADLAMPALLYELLIPNELKSQPLESANLLLVLDAAAAQYPWEMMAERRLQSDRAGQRELRPFSVHMGMLRQLKTAHHRSQVQAPRAQRALVIGEPKLNDPRYPALPGASAEAAAVARVLEEQRFAVTSLIGADAITIIDALFREEYRIIHIAGHGIYRPERPEQSGVVLGDGIYITAAEIGQLRIVPELVFLNCCHLGQQDQPSATPAGPREQTQRAWNRLAASISQQLIQIGVRAVVAAGWAVQDAAAEAFAVKLYRELLVAERPRNSFGEAVRTARQHLFYDPRFQTANTWGAYQCYGDPGFTLRSPVGSSDSAPQTPGADHFVAPHEIMRRLRNIQARASHIEDRGWLTRLNNQTKALEEQVRTQLPADWFNGEMRNEFGDTYAELRDFPAAIQRYRLALSASGPKERVPFRTAEQLANLESRFAVDLISGGAAQETADAGQETWDAHELLQSAETRLRLLLAMAETAERWSLLAGFYKRRARISTSEVERRAALQAAAASYQQAYQISSPRSQPYAAFNWVTCRLLAADALSAEERTLLQEKIEASLQALAHEHSTDRSFWDRISRPDAELAKALVAPAGAGDQLSRQQVDEIVRHYRSVMAITGTKREHDTVLGNLDFLSEILTHHHQTGLAAALRRVREQVTPAPPPAD